LDLPFLTQSDFHYIFWNQQRSLLEQEWGLGLTNIPCRLARVAVDTVFMCRKPDA